MGVARDAEMSRRFSTKKALPEEETRTTGAYRFWLLREPLVPPLVETTPAITRVTRDWASPDASTLSPARPRRGGQLPDVDHSLVTPFAS